MKYPILYVPFKPLGYRRGAACYWFIMIKKDFKGDQGLIDHEKCHLRQQRDIGLFKYAWLYLVKKDPRFIAEVEYAAFKYGSKYTDGRIKHILENNYNVPIDVINEVIG